MADEIEEPEVEEPEGEEAPKTDKSGKTVEAKFTQKELDSAIKARLGRAKKEFDAELNAVVSERDTLRKELDAIDAGFAAQVEELSKGIDDDILALMEGLSNREKVAKLTKLQGKLGKVIIPVTPKSETPDKDAPKFKRHTNI